MDLFRVKDLHSSGGTPLGPAVSAPGLRKQGSAGVRCSEPVRLVVHPGRGLNAASFLRGGDGVPTCGPLCVPPPAGPEHPGRRRVPHGRLLRSKDLLTHETYRGCRDST